MAEAVAVRVGRIVAVGCRDDVLKLEGHSTRVVDLAGKTMIPGLIDAHGHVFGTGIQALAANLLPPPDARRAGPGLHHPADRDRAPVEPFGDDEQQGSRDRWHCGGKPEPGRRCDPTEIG
jgi:predicted amidohydrolase YtcJ